MSGKVSSAVRLFKKKPLKDKNCIIIFCKTPKHMSGHKAYKCNCKQLIFLFLKFMCVYNICVYVFILVHMLFPAHAHPRSSGSCTGKRWFVLQEEVQCVCVFISVWVFVRLGGEPQLRGLAPYCKLHSRWRGQRLSSLLLTSPAAPLLAPAISALNYCTYSACIEEHQLQFLSRYAFTLQWIWSNRIYVRHKKQPLGYSTNMLTYTFLYCTASPLLYHRASVIAQASINKKISEFLLQICPAEKVLWQWEWLSGGSNCAYRDWTPTCERGEKDATSSGWMKEIYFLVRHTTLGVAWNSKCSVWL